MGLRPLEMFYSSSPDMDFRRQLAFPASFEYLYVMGLYGRQKICSFFQCGDRLYTSESDVYRRQILTYEDGPRAERVKRWDIYTNHKDQRFF